MQLKQPPFVSDTMRNPGLGRDFFLASADKNGHNRIYKGGHFRQRFACMIELGLIYPGRVSVI